MKEQNLTFQDFRIEEGDNVEVVMAKTPTGGQVVYVHINGITRLRAQQSPLTVGNESAPIFKFIKEP